MLREMIPIILLFLKIVLTCAQAGNDVQQSNQLPEGQICLFTCSEWIFKEKVQQFAPSANLLGPGYLSKHKIGFSNNDPKCQDGNDSPLKYAEVWGAVYSINKNEYDNVLKQSQSEYSVPFASNEDVFVVNYKEMNCLVVDLGIQPGDHPPWRHFNMKIPNTIEDDAYFNRLAQIGVPQEYIKALQNASLKPQYHPIIPEDYHPRQIGSEPKRTYDQLPIAEEHPNPRQLIIENGLKSGQIPETHDGETPRLAVNDIPTTPIQLTGPKKLLPGVVTPGSQPQVVTDVPKQVQRNIPMGGVQPGPNDVLVNVPEDIDSNHQPTVVITPMKMPESSVISQPIGNSPDQSQVLIPRKLDNSNLVIPVKGPVLTTLQPRDIDDTAPIAVTGVAHPITNVVNPTLPEATQTPVDDQSYVVITPLKLPQNQANLGSVPVGQDYVVQTPISLQPDDTVQQTLVPKSIDNVSTEPRDVPPMLLSGPKQSTQVVPDNTPTNQPMVIQQPTEQNNLLLTPDIIAPPKLQTQAPDLLINPSTQIGNEPVSESLPTSYNIPSDHNIPGATSGLLTLSPSPDLVTTHQNDSPLLTLNSDTPQLVTKPTLVPNTVDLDNNPNLLKTNTQPSSDHTIHAIPASFSVPMPTPITEDKPMFGFIQSSQPNNGFVGSAPTTSSDVSKPVPLLSNQPNNHIVHSIPTTSNAPEPVPILSDKPMFSLDQSKPDLVSHQISPNIIASGNKPDLLLTNTAPNHLILQPAGDQTVPSIPPSFGVIKPAPVLQDKPMFSFDQNNHPSITIPTTFGITNQPADVKDKPMFTLDNPLSIPQPQPKPIDDVNSVSTVDTPLVPGQNVLSNNAPLTSTVPQIPNSVDNAHPVQLTSQPDHVPRATTTPDSHTIKLPNAAVDNSQPVTLVSQPGTISLANPTPLNTIAKLPNVTPSQDNQFSNVPLTNTIPNSHTIQPPSLVADDSKPITLASLPVSAPLTMAQPAIQPPTKAPLTIDRNIASQPAVTVSPVQTPSISTQPIQPVHAPPTYIPSNFMAPNYTPASPALGYTFAYRYPQYLHNCRYKPPNTYYNPDDLIPGFTFGSHIQLYD